MKATSDSHGGLDALSPVYTTHFSSPNRESAHLRMALWHLASTPLTVVLIVMATDTVCCLR